MSELYMCVRTWRLLFAFVWKLIAAVIAVGLVVAHKASVNASSVRTTKLTFRALGFVISCG